MTRTFTIEERSAHDGFQRGFSHRSYKRFVLHTEGLGHWCVGGAESGFFASRADAENAGQLWIETGIPPAEQTPVRIERIRRDRQLLETANLPEAEVERVMGRAA